MSGPAWKVGDRAFWRGTRNIIQPGASVEYSTVFAQLPDDRKHALVSDFDVIVTGVTDDGRPFRAQRVDADFTFDPSIDIACLERVFEKGGVPAENLATRKRTLDMLKAGVTPLGSVRDRASGVTMETAEERADDMVQTGAGPMPSADVSELARRAGIPPGKTFTIVPVDPPPEAETVTDKVALSAYLAEVERVEERNRLINEVIAAVAPSWPGREVTRNNLVAAIKEAALRLRRAANDVQAEAARANERDGVIAFLAGALDHVRYSTLDALACGGASRALNHIELWKIGKWTPGPHDALVNWDAKETRAIGKTWQRSLRYGLPKGASASFEDAVNGTPELTAAEALFGFAGWLTTRDEQTIMSARDNTAPIAELVKRFCDENALSPPRDGWHRLLKHPSDTQGAGLGWDNRDVARAASPVHLTGVLGDQTWVAFRSEPSGATGEAMLRSGQIVTVVRDSPGGVWRVLTWQDRDGKERVIERTVEPAPVEQAGGPVPRSAEQLARVLADNLSEIIGNHIRTGVWERRDDHGSVAPGWWYLQTDDVVGNLHLWERLGTAQAALGALKGYSGTARGFALTTEPVAAEPTRNPLGGVASAAALAERRVPVTRAGEIMGYADGREQPAESAYGYVGPARLLTIARIQGLSVLEEDGVRYVVGTLPGVGPMRIEEDVGLSPDGIETSGPSEAERLARSARKLAGREQPEAEVVEKWHLPPGGEGRHVVAVADAPQAMPSANAAIEERQAERSAEPRHEGSPPYCLASCAICHPMPCCSPGCGKAATFGVIAENAPPTPDNIGETQACDAHLVEIGLTTLKGHPDATGWRVWPLPDVEASSDFEDPTKGLAADTLENRLAASRPRRLAEEAWNESLEAAYWAYNTRRAKRGQGEDERDSFKAAIRAHLSAPSSVQPMDVRRAIGLALDDLSEAAGGEPFDKIAHVVEWIRERRGVARGGLDVDRLREAVKYLWQGVGQRDRDVSDGRIRDAIAIVDLVIERATRDQKADAPQTMPTANAAIEERQAGRSRADAAKQEARDGDWSPADILKSPYPTTKPTPEQVAEAHAQLERDKEIVLRGPEATAYRDLAAAALAVEDTHAANQDAQCTHQIKVVALSRLLAEAGRAAHKKGNAP